MVLRGYIDESVKGPLFSLSCLISEGDTWSDLEKQWVDCLEAKNRELRKSGRRTISRFHASDCNSREGEYAGWDPQEKQEFQNALVAIFNKYPFYADSYGVHLEEMMREIPLTKSNPEGFAYVIFLGHIMLDVIEDVLTPNPGMLVRLFHDHCKCDAALIDMFNHMIEAPDIEERHRFISLSPERWEFCIPLQPADLMAYENRVELGRKYSARGRRNVLDNIMRNSHITGRALHFDVPNLAKMHSIFDEMNDTTKDILRAIARLSAENAGV